MEFISEDLGQVPDHITTSQTLKAPNESTAVSETPGRCRYYSPGAHQFPYSMC